MTTGLTIDINLPANDPSLKSVHYSIVNERADLENFMTSKTFEKDLRRNNVGLREHLDNTETTLGSQTDDYGEAVMLPPSVSLPHANLHALMILSDSALPLGSFALSGGLESFIAHQSSPSHGSRLNTFQHFLRLSLRSLASNTIPFVCAAFLDLNDWARLDNDIDASISCTVAQRASLSQGRALLTVWERSLETNAINESSTPRAITAKRALNGISSSLKQTPSAKDLDSEFDESFDPIFSRNWGHFAPMMGVLCVAMSLSLEEALYLFVIAHAKMILSAGIRASLLGPYQAHNILASGWLKHELSDLIQPDLIRKTDNAAQTACMIDMWSGRHEKIYSRIFNS